MKKYNPVISNPIPNEDGRVPITYIIFYEQAKKLKDEYQPRQLEEIHIDRCPDRGGYVLFFYLDKGHTTYRHTREG